MPKIRILVVDDSVVARRWLTERLASDTDLEVCGSAATGSIALAKVAQLQPNLVLLDVEMPEMSGLETLSRLRQSNPELPVIMFSSYTQLGAAATLEALTLGAADYVTKPSRLTGGIEADACLNGQLIPKIKALGQSGSSRPSPPLPPILSIVPELRPLAGPNSIRVVAVGVSTGGPNALATLLTPLPGTFPVPLVIVQHMPPVFTRLLAQSLSHKTELVVLEAEPGMELKPGHAYLAPGDFHLVVERTPLGIHLQTNQKPPENSCRPAVDVLFRSVAEVFGSAALGVILTGMGQDGLRGCQALCAAGGTVFAQDEATSVVWGMPGFVVKSGLAEKVVPLDTMAAEIQRRVNFPHSKNQEVPHV